MNMFVCVNALASVQHWLNLNYYFQLLIVSISVISVLWILKGLKWLYWIPAFCNHQSLGDKHHKD